MRYGEIYDVEYYKTCVEEFSAIEEAVEYSYEKERVIEFEYKNILFTIFPWENREETKQKIISQVENIDKEEKIKQAYEYKDSLIEQMKTCIKLLEEIK